MSTNFQSIFNLINDTAPPLRGPGEVNSLILDTVIITAIITTVVLFSIGTLAVIIWKNTRGVKVL